MSPHEAKIVLEAALLTAQQPLSLTDISKLFGDEFDNGTLQALLDELQRNWQDRGVELIRLASGWRFQSTPAMRMYLERLSPDNARRHRGNPGCDGFDPGHQDARGARVDRNRRSPRGTRQAGVAGNDTCLPGRPGPAVAAGAAAARK
jgi:hypothetical protein